MEDTNRSTISPASFSNIAALLCDVWRGIEVLVRGERRFLWRGVNAAPEFCSAELWAGLSHVTLAVSRDAAQSSWRGSDGGLSAFSDLLT